MKAWLRGKESPWQMCFQLSWSLGLFLTCEMRMLGGIGFLGLPVGEKCWKSLATQEVEIRRIEF
jgi:hypothetical protein